MRDANTQIYRFVIQDPPPPPASATPDLMPNPDDSGAGLDIGDLPPLPGMAEPGPVAVRPGKLTPGRMATPRRPLPPVKTTRQQAIVTPRSDGMLVAAGLLLGIGVGGGIDGSMFDQLLLFHAGPGAVAAGEVLAVKTQPLWDGLLHGGAWVMALVGLGLLWRVMRTDVPRRTSTFVGALLLGWGFFNGVEGALDHQLLRMHQAQPGPAQLLWDSGLIVSGVLFMMIGALCLGFSRRS